MQIVNFFYELARTNKRLNGFAYGRAGSKGAGSEAHPLMWLDDPIYGEALNLNSLRFTCNVDILGIPTKPSEIATVQDAAFSTGLSLRERIKAIAPVSGISIEAFSFVSLSEYTDNDAAGYRFTFRLMCANPVDRCADDYDPAKQFPKVDDLPDFLTENPEGCAIFSDKSGLPNFELTI